MIEFQTLKKCSLEEIHQAFVDAFSDYVVDLPMPFEAFTEMMKRRGLDTSFSMGAFDDHKIAGFILNGCRRWQGKKTCYDLGTGVLSYARGQSLTKKMLDHLIPELRDRGVKQYLLEVIQENKPAYKIYQKSGFEITRSLNCYVAEIKDLRIEQTTDIGRNISSDRRSQKSKRVYEKPLLFDIAVESLEDLADPNSPHWSVFQRTWNFSPSWQNSIDSVCAVFDQFDRVVARNNGKFVGYGIVHKSSGDIPQFGVLPEMRHRGIGSAIFEKMIELSNSEQLIVLNVDSDDHGTNTFLKKLNLPNKVQQFEMLRMID